MISTNNSYNDEGSKIKETGVNEMALTVKDILELPSGQKMQMLAGGKGLNRLVSSVEIADYEFAPDLDFAPGAAVNIEEDMEAGSFIITSFLFAKDDPSAILPAVRALHEMGMAALAFKQVIYETLPDEVLEFADKNSFPILSFGKSVWFENIIFDIMYAVQFDDKVYLSEEKIDSMLSGYMNRSELDIVLKGISLRLQPYVSVVYISGDLLDAGRILRSFYLLKGFHGKGLMARYGNGLFLIVTSARDDHKSHDLIRREVNRLDRVRPQAGLRRLCGEIVQVGHGLRQGIKTGFQYTDRSCCQTQLLDERSEGLRVRLGCLGEILHRSGLVDRAPLHFVELSRGVGVLLLKFLRLGAVRSGGLGRLLDLILQTLNCFLLQGDLGLKVFGRVCLLFLSGGVLIVSRLRCL